MADSSRIVSPDFGWAARRSLSSRRADSLDGQATGSITTAGSLRASSASLRSSKSCRRDSRGTPALTRIPRDEASAPYAVARHCRRHEPTRARRALRARGRARDARALVGLARRSGQRPRPLGGDRSGGGRRRAREQPACVGAPLGPPAAAPAVAARRPLSRAEPLRDGLARRLPLVPRRTFGRCASIRRDYARVGVVLAPLSILFALGALRLASGRWL